jgi:mono/diheme cytochrome c family protein
MNGQSLRSQAIGLMALILICLAGVACRQDMHDQPKYKPYRESAFFADGASARQPVQGTVARGQLRDDVPLYTGKKASGKAAQSGDPMRNYVDEFPFPITEEVLNRGQERFNIFCSPCHGRLGDGQGMVARRGLKQPPPANFHSERLRGAPAGYFFDVITNGFGGMQDYSDKIPVRDRWAIVAYIRALQLSQNARIEDVPPEERSNLEKQ